MSEGNNKTFIEFVEKKCSNLLNSENGVPKEQAIIIAYEKGFMDALQILEAENIIKTYFYP